MGYRDFFGEPRWDDEERKLNMSNASTRALRAEIDGGSSEEAFADVVARLEKIAKDENASDDDVRRAEEALKALAYNQNAGTARRSLAGAALGRIRAKSALAARMSHFGGIKTQAPRPYLRAEMGGTFSQIVPTMTPKEARAFLASKGGGR